MIYKKEEKGITLIALIISIIIMLILAGVAISLLMSPDGIIGKADKAAKIYNSAAVNEQDRINETLDYINVPDLTDENVQFSINPNGWTNGDVKVSINTELSGYILQYSLDNGNTWTNYSNELSILDNGKRVLARLEKNGIAAGIAGITIYSIDREIPKEFSISANNVTEKGFTINASTEDADATEINGKSGIEKYIYYIKKSKESTYTTTTVLENNYTYSELDDDTEYNVYLEAYDKAGNLRQSNAITIKTEKGDLPATEITNAGNYVKYSGNGYTSWRVLYNDGQNISLISVGNVENRYLAGMDGYNNGIAYLNGVANKYNDGNFSQSARSVNKDDYYSMRAIGAHATGAVYWLANNNYVSPGENYGYANYTVCLIGTTGKPTAAIFDNSTIIDTEDQYIDRDLGRAGAILWYVNVDYGFTFGVRVVVKLKSGVNIIGGTGTQADPYILSF